MRRWAILWIGAALVLAVAAACGRDSIGVIQASAAQTQPGMGMLAGRVTRGPLSPVERGGGASESAPVAGARVVVSSPAGAEVASAVTGNRGDYAVDLAPGTYRVTIVVPPGAGFTKDLPATVAIGVGQVTRVDIRIDTGIR